jgi:hypothetical protein
MRKVFWNFQKINCKLGDASAQEIILRPVGRKPTIGSFVLLCRFESKAVITSKIEHHAVLYTVQALQNLDSSRLQSSQMEK